MLCLPYLGPLIRSHPASNLLLVTFATALLLITLTPSGVSAQTDAVDSDEWLPASQPQPQALSRTGNDIVSVSLTDLLSKLALIGVLIYAAIWGLKQWQGRTLPTPPGSNSGLLRVRERLSLGPNTRLHIVQFGSRNLLIATVGDRVTLLTGNSASEMEAETSRAAAAEQQLQVGDTSSLPRQAPDSYLSGDLNGYGGTGQYQRQSYDANGARVRAENFRRTADWESRRDALVRALQESVES